MFFFKAGGKEVKGVYLKTCVRIYGHQDSQHTAIIYLPVKVVPGVSGPLNASQVRARRHSPVATLSMSDIRPRRRGTNDAEVKDVATNGRSA